MSKCLCRAQIAAPNPRSNLNMTRASIMLVRAAQGRSPVPKESNDLAMSLRQPPCPCTL